MLYRPPIRMPLTVTKARLLTKWIGLGLAALVLAGVAVLAGFFASTPSVGNAEQIVRTRAAEHDISYPGIVPPPRFVAALVATEDHRFFSPVDFGIDPFAILRVGLGLAIGAPDQGGSNITEQVAKMLYSPNRHGLLVGAQRVAIAMKLQLAYSKTEILKMYAELAYYSHGFYGIESASCGYFGREPAALSWAQAAMLAGVVNAPSLDDPISHPAAASARERHVLDRLVAVGTLTRHQADAILAGGLQLAPDGEGCADGAAD